MNATINDVAKHAGVSIKTVSRVMNNEQTVKQSTELKVRESIEVLNYRPNNSARSLAGSRSYNIGYIYDNPNAYHVTATQQGILNECKDNHFQLLIHPCDHKSDNLELELSSLLRFSRMAGIVLSPPFTEMPNIIKLLETLDLPYVKIISGSEEKEQSNCIYIDDKNSAYDITQYLIQLGHSKIGFLSGGINDQSSIQRLHGYEQALNDNKIKSSKEYVIQGEYSFDSGVKGAKKLINLSDRPTAIFASNDEIAAGAFFAAQQMNLSVPDELSIAGFEDSPFSRQTWPNLTTAYQQNELIAQMAAKLLISKIQNWSDQKVDAQGIITRFKPELVKRDSTTSLK